MLKPINKNKKRKLTITWSIFLYLPQKHKNHYIIGTSYDIHFSFFIYCFYYCIFFAIILKFYLCFWILLFNLMPTETGIYLIIPCKYCLCLPFRITSWQFYFIEASALFLSRPKLMSKAATSYGVLWVSVLLAWLLIIKFFPFVALIMLIIFVIATTLFI